MSLGLPANLLVWLPIKSWKLGHCQDERPRMGDIVLRLSGPVAFYAGIRHQLAPERWNMLEHARAAGEGMFHAVTSRQQGGART
jgi:hypothetical protein